MRGLGCYAFASLTSLVVLLNTEISMEHLAIVCVVDTVIGFAMAASARLYAFINELLDNDVFR